MDYRDKELLKQQISSILSEAEDDAPRTNLSKKMIILFFLAVFVPLSIFGHIFF